MEVAGEGGAKDQDWEDHCLTCCVWSVCDVKGVRLGIRARLHPAADMYTERGAQVSCKRACEDCLRREVDPQVDGARKDVGPRDALLRVHDEAEDEAYGGGVGVNPYVGRSIRSAHARQSRATP